MTLIIVAGPLKCMNESQALCHPYVAQFHNDSEEPIYPTPPIKIAMDDNTKFSVSEYRDRLYKEIVRKKKEIRRRLR